jgi:hypothetical protein
VRRTEAKASGDKSSTSSRSRAKGAAASNSVPDAALHTLGRAKPIKLELMELENIVANTVYLKAREGQCAYVFFYLAFVIPFPFLRSPPAPREN